MPISSVPRLLLRSKIWLCLLAGLVLIPSVTNGRAVADIGASLDRSKELGSVHAAKHRGRHPLYKTNARGIVIWECWEAPSGGWTKPQAMSLVKDLIPQALKAQIPRKMKSEPGGEKLVYQDGTTVWLEFSPPRALYRLVAVWTGEYRGPTC